MMNPIQTFQQMINPQIMKNPMMQNAFGMLQNNDVKGLQNLAENICKEKGINVSELQRQMEQRYGRR